jgi:hypothetical protein
MAGKKQGSITTYRPGVVERVTDATVGALVRQAHRAMGSSEKEAAREANRVLQNVEDLTGLRALENSAKRILYGNGNKGDYATVGVAAVPGVAGMATRQVVKQGVKRGARAVDEAVLGQRVRNQVVPAPNPKATSSMLTGRALTDPKQVKYAERRMSPAELEDAQRTGRFRVPKQGTKFSQSDTPTKWWSAADEEGVFGRPWIRNDTTRVRLPADKVPSGRAARVRDAEVWDSTTGTWRPAKRKAKGGAVKADKPIKKRGDGIARRGKTKGRMV